MIRKYFLQGLLIGAFCFNVISYSSVPEDFNQKFSTFLVADHRNLSKSQIIPALREFKELVDEYIRYIEKEPVIDMSANLIHLCILLMEMRLTKEVDKFFPHTLKIEPYLRDAQKAVEIANNLRRS